MERLRSLEMLEVIINRSRAMVFLWRFNEEFPVDYVTDNVRLLGYEPEDFYSGRVSWPRITFTGDEPRLRAEVERYLALGVDSWSQEYRLYDKTGDLRWVEDHNRVIRDDTGAITHIQGIVLDVSERKQIELGLEAAWSTFHSIVQRSHEGVIVLDVGEQVLFLNEAAQVMLGKSLAEIKGKPFPLAFELGASMEVAIRRLGGVTGVGELRSQPTHWHGQAATLVTVVDVTEQLQAEREVELQRARNLRIDRLTALGEMASSIAHEINQPLGSISMGIDNILLKMQSGELTDEYTRRKTESIFRDIDRIRNIIEHVRVFSRDQQNAVLEPISVGEVVMNALSLISRQYENQGIDLKIKYSGRSDITLGNKYKLEQVVMNILSNARFAVLEKSKAEEKDYEMVIKISTFVNRKTCGFIIHDNGTGIPENIIGNIFDPFFTTKQEERGTGLGLSIIYGIVKEMKGDIEVDSKEGKHTQLVVSLPLYKEKKETKN